MIISHGAGLFKPFMRMNGKADQRVVAHKSCALAAQTFMLSITAEGYDTCPMEGTDTIRIRKLLNLPYGAEINMVVAVGKGTADGIYNERMRLPFEEVVYTL
jgi:nitroreductase